MRPTILSANVRSCLHKLDDIRLCALSKKANIVCITETWLHASIPDSICDITNYSLHRADRPDRKGGGAATWISNAIAHSRVNIPLHKPDFIDCVWLHLHHTNTLLINMYIPPTPAVQHLDAINSYIIDSVDWFVNSHASCSIILCGDLNRFDTDNICLHLDLNNLVTVPTRGTAILDFLLISTVVSHLYNVSVCAPISSSDHNSIVCTSMYPNLNPDLPTTHKVYDLRQSHIANFVNAVNSIDWTLLYKSDLSVNLKCSIFHDTLSDCFSATIPVQDIPMSGNEPPWFTPRLKLVINQRWEAFRSGDMNRYNYLKLKVKSMIITAKSNWASKFKTGKSSKSMWCAVNHLAGRSRTPNSLANLLSKFDSTLSCSNAINLNPTSNFQLENQPVATPHLLTAIITLGTVIFHPTWSLKP